MKGSAYDPAEPADPNRGRYLELVAQALSRAVGQLGSKDRLRLSYYYVQELTLAEIGRLLKEHEATVSRQLARTRRAVRAAVERELRDDAGLTEAQVAECFASVAADPGPLDLQPLLVGARVQAVGAFSMKRSMDDLLRDTLRARAADPTAACLDPETAAAFVDGTMSRRERAGAEAHVADCPRCQAVLAALVRSTPPPLERAWWRRPAVAWLAPLTVAATAVAIWISVPDTQASHPSRRCATRLRHSRPRRFSCRRQRGKPRSRHSRRSDLTPPHAPGPETVRVREAATASAKVRLARATPDASANSGDARQPSRGRRRLRGSAAAIGRTPGVSRGCREVRHQERAGRRQQQSGRRAPNVDRVVVAEPVRPSALAGDQIRDRRHGRPRGGDVVVSSNRISQWRIGNGGEVQHSADGGSTWRTQATGVNVTLAAGSSPSPSVCWLVGPGGLVLITTDEGQSWRRVPFPVVTDLVSVRATDESDGHSRHLGRAYVRDV